MDLDDAGGILLAVGVVVIACEPGRWAIGLAVTAVGAALVVAHRLTNRRP